MSLAVSPAVKVFALVGVLAALVLGAGMMLMGGETEADVTAGTVPVNQSGLLDAPARAKKVAAKAKASAAAKQAVATPAKAKPAAKATPTAKPKVRAKPVASNGLPTEIMVALRSHNVVVVSLWGTGGKIDEMSRDEAAAGASAVGAGFVSFNVIERGREAEALTLKLGMMLRAPKLGMMLRAPTVLLFTSGGKLANTLEGFRDRETVGQAALNALR